MTPQIREGKVVCFSTSSSLVKSPISKVICFLKTHGKRDYVEQLDAVLPVPEGQPATVVPRPLLQAQLNK